MIEICSPKPFLEYDTLPRIFLAGSIEMGNAANWQASIARDMCMYSVVLLNPRRPDWDSSWIQSIDDANFARQVTWELDGIECADTVIFYFDPDTKSPITLMELGIVAGAGHCAVVCCPDGFWRKGNVEVICARYGIRLVNTYSELLNIIQARYIGYVGV